MMNVQCATCGEIYNVSDKFSMQSAPCPACGSIGAVELGVEEPAPPPPPPDAVAAPPPPEDTVTPEVVKKPKKKRPK
jgi:predicted  nucleic acid-binding Zn-ribbon protein